MQTRSFSDRVRHALSFEIVGLAIFTPLATLAFDKPALDMGMIGLISATVATLWNFVFNIGFDRAMIRLTGSAAKSLRVRIIHTLMFEGGLIVALIPMIAWYLGITLWQALVNTIPVRLTLFTISSIVLTVLAVRALMATLGA